MGGDEGGKMSGAWSWLEELGEVSDDAEGLTRTFLSPALERAKNLVAGWMREAGLEVYEDQAGNLIGRWDCGDASAGTLVCGSHLDTVRNAGRFDGALGVVAGIAAVGQLIRTGARLPFHVEVVAFSDEEGVRFQTTYLGSGFYTGQLGDLERAAVDRDGVSVAVSIAAHRPSFPSPPRRRLIGYVEAHIEQGPVLEREGLALGVATAIAGQTRAGVIVEGAAGHAGTTPMIGRRDAMAGAAEAILVIEKEAKIASGVVATVGELHIKNAAGNVIPGRVEFTVDARAADDAVRAEFCENIFREIDARLTARGLTVRVEMALDAPAVRCSEPLTNKLAAMVTTLQGRCELLASGAGHDVVMLSRVTDTALLFVRCRGGLSHHPAEWVEPADVALCVEALTKLIESGERP